MRANPTREGYTIRAARAADLDRLALLLANLQDHVEGSNPDLWRMKAEGRDEQRQQIAYRLGAGGACALVAEHRQAGVIGCLFGHVAVNKQYEPARTGLIDQLFVHEDHRRAGVATRLLDAACRFFAAREIDDISLRYAVGNKEAAAFWAAAGFTPRIIIAGSARTRVEARVKDKPAEG